MLKPENRKAVVAFIGSLLAMLTILGFDAGGIKEIFTEERIDLLTVVLGLAAMIARSVWEVPNLPSEPPQLPPPPLPLVPEARVVDPVAPPHVLAEIERIIEARLAIQPPPEPERTAPAPTSGVTP